MIRLEQKSKALNLDLITKFFPPGQLVLDPFTWTLPTASGCLLARKHHQFIDCEIDSGCVRPSMPGVVQVYVRQLLSDNFGPNRECKADS